MKFPQVIICSPDDWVANQLKELAADHRWKLRVVRQPAAVAALVEEPRPTVLVVQADPDADRPDRLQLVADTHRRRPDVATVVVSDAKLSDDDRPGWAAAALDLGARLVLFPPFTRPVLEDVIGGLMAATIRRTTGDAPAPAFPPALKPPTEAVIDLADEQYRHD